MATCVVCGVTAEDPPITWSTQQSERGEQWLCTDCTRENLRSIEARLGEAWW